MRRVHALLVAVATGLGGGCVSSSAESTGATWLAREPDVRAAQLERQLRGLDVAMLETGHRYVELYWAGRDANWEAAAYQAQKIRLAIENGLERRPKRAESARPFLSGPLAAMETAAAARDPELFAARFRDLTAGCNACHKAEEVPYFEIRPPETRVSPVRRGGRAP
jgi:hypothetical protein